MEIAVIAIILLLALSSLRFIGKFFSLIMRSTMKLVILVIFIVIAVYALDHYNVKVFNKDDLPQIKLFGK